MLYPVDISVHDLAEPLNEHLAVHGFQRRSLEDLIPAEREYLHRRDARTIANAVPLTPAEQWREEGEYLLFQNGEGMVAYIRHHPRAPQSYSHMSFEAHLGMPAPAGLNGEQYHSLAVTPLILSLLKRKFQEQHPGIMIGAMKNSNVLMRLPVRVEDVADDNFPVRVSHSVYVSAARNIPGGNSGKRAVASISQAMVGIIVEACLYARKQIAYYRAEAEVDSAFGGIALVG